MADAATNTSGQDSDLIRLYPQLSGVPYRSFLTRLHAVVEPEWYLEIGTSRGDSLALSRARSVAVDPAFRIKHDIAVHKGELHLFQMTSDEFFDDAKRQAWMPRFDLAFLDGMHLFEYLLRDFINTERYCASQSVIAIHDCVPITLAAADRTWVRSRTRQWTGDVWKLVPILQKYRPGLQIRVVDCPPSGLVLVTGLDPENRVLTEAYDDIFKEYEPATISSYGKDRLYEELAIISSESEAAAPYDKDVG